MNDTWLQLVGRWHPVLVHAPLGALFALLAVELGDRLRFRAGPEDAWRGRTPRRLLCGVTALSAIAAASSGWLLAQEGEYGGSGLDWHRRLGIALAVALSAACLAALLHRRRPYYAALAVALGLAGAAGHFGGELTHGPGFLTEPLRLARASTEASPAEGAGPTWYEASVAPVFASRCVRCHGEAKHKGGLSLHDAEALMAGGDSGAVIVPGNADGSELMRRLRLELEHDDHMPPSAKPQPTPAEVAAIGAWIAAGASFDAPLPKDVAAASVAEAVEPTEPDGSPEPSAPVPALTAAQLEGLHAQRIHAEVIDPADQGLWVHFAARPDADDAFVEEHLRPALPFVVDLSLAGTQAGDGALALVGRMPRLERLDLSRTGCTSAGLEALADHPCLRTLIVTATPLDDGALATLFSLSALESLFAWQTAMSPAGLAELQRRHPALRIVADSQLDTQPLETEAPWSFTSEYEAQNTTCPVTGEPIDPRFRIVHDGQVIGFCCSRCPATFWAQAAATEAGD